MNNEVYACTLQTKTSVHYGIFVMYTVTSIHKHVNKYCVDMLAVFVIGIIHVGKCVHMT